MRKTKKNGEISKGYRITKATPLKDYVWEIASYPSEGEDMIRFMHKGKKICISIDNTIIEEL